MVSNTFARARVGRRAVDVRRRRPARYIIMLILGISTHVHVLYERTVTAAYILLSYVPCVYSAVGGLEIPRIMF